MVRDAKQAEVSAVTLIQRVHRGGEGRAKAAQARVQHSRQLEENKAASKMQAHVRREQETKRVEIMRAERLEKMHKSAIIVRKYFLRFVARRNYLNLKAEFASHVEKVVTMQRYTRGFLVRLRMWGEAVRAEEELWAVLEVQRVWRGYKGRQAWENKYEEMWRREMAGSAVGRQVRGWLARVRVGRLRRKIARVEFERARLRFRAAQRLQAFARGINSRRQTSARRARKLKATAHIQKVMRGHMLRKRLWAQVIDLRATMISAVARGFLVRNRRFHLVAKVILIQRTVRQWLSEIPAEIRAQKLESARMREKMATVVQQTYRKHLERKKVAAGP